jgi:hypothetical protein
MRKVVKIIEGMKERTGMTYGMICKRLQLSLGEF